MRVKKKKEPDMSGLFQAALDETRAEDLLALARMLIPIGLSPNTVEEGAERCAVFGYIEKLVEAKRKRRRDLVKEYMKHFNDQMNREDIWPG